MVDVSYDRDRLLLYLAAVFAGLTVLLGVAAAVTQPFLLVLALPFAVTTYFLWYQATGRLAERARRRAATGGGRRRAGERTAATGPGGFDGGWRARRSPPGGGRSRTRPPDDDQGPTDAEAYRTLGLTPDADDEAVRRAYRERVKECHPDRGGDEETFKRVTAAYERLR